MVFSYFLMTLLAFAGLFLIGLILLQRGRGGGLAGAFGGMGGQSAFGTKAGDVFTRITIGVASAWILLCAGSVLALHFSAGGRIDSSLLKNDVAVDAVEKAQPKKDEAPAIPDDTKKSEDAKKTEDAKKPAGAAPAADAKSNDAAKPKEGDGAEKKTEEAKPAEPKPDAPKPDAPKADAPKEEAPKADAPKAEEAKPAEPKSEAPKAEEPK